jgi:hypothetical protein
MAAYFDYLSFKSCLPWYKRIMFPLFLNKKEYDEYIRIITEEKTELDEARDHYLFCWNEYMKNPTYQTKASMEQARNIVKMYLRQENKYYENTPRPNKNVNYLLRRTILI